eukprot:PhM_4_TR14694/c3_g4_i2/m.68335
MDMVQVPALRVMLTSRVVLGVRWLGVSDSEGVRALVGVPPSRVSDGGMESDGLRGSSLTLELRVMRCVTVAVNVVDCDAACEGVGVWPDGVAVTDGVCVASVDSVRVWSEVNETVMDCVLCSESVRVTVDDKARVGLGGDAVCDKVLVRDDDTVAYDVRVCRDVLTDTVVVVDNVCSAVTVGPGVSVGDSDPESDRVSESVGVAVGDTESTSVREKEAEADTVVVPDGVADVVGDTKAVRVDVAELLERPTVLVPENVPVCDVVSVAVGVCERDGVWLFVDVSRRECVSAVVLKDAVANEAEEVSEAVCDDVDVAEGESVEVSETVSVWEGDGENDSDAENDFETVCASVVEGV